MGKESDNKDLPQPPLRLVFFASGNGSALRAIAKAFQERRLAAEPVLLLAGANASGALQFAEANQIPAHIITPDEDTAILAHLAEASPDLIILGGYLRKLSARIVSAWTPYILNIHPALLPKFGGKGMYGRRVHEAVLAAGESESGASVHLVDNEYDRGSVIAQARLAVEEQDTPQTLEARVMALEKKLLLAVIGELADKSKQMQSASEKRCEFAIRELLERPYLDPR